MNKLIGLLGVVSLAIVLLFCMRDAPQQRVRRAAEQPVQPTVISGHVVDDAGPVVGARVRIKGTRISSVTDSAGHFSLSPMTPRARLTISKSGYLIQGLDASRRSLRVKLEPLPAADNTDYCWVDPTPDPSRPENCGNCHAQIYDEWQAGGHAASVTNPRFQSLYRGTDWTGRAERGWSLVADHPLGIGVCAACHAPGIHFESGASDDIRDTAGVAAQGVHCDYCHKIHTADTERIGTAHGRFGHQLLRPHQGQLFFGPLDDVDRGEDSFSPLQSHSRICASCHEGTVFGVHVYSTFSEWLVSPARRQGLHCQSCHMLPTGQMTNVAPGNGGIERDPTTLASHSLLPGGIAKMLKRSVSVDVRFGQRGGRRMCRVSLLAQDVGHRVPTGFVDRHLLLVVEPRDAEGQRLRVLEGPLLPRESGPQLVGLPGRVFGRLLVDEGGRGPVPFWRAAELAYDSRLIPEQPEATVFELPASSREVRVRVLYRRFWQAVAVEKEWPDETVVVWDKLVGS